MNFNNLNTLNSSMKTAQKGQSLDILGLSQQAKGEQLAMLGEQGEGLFAKLLGQIEGGADGIASLLGGKSLENPEQVFDLIDHFPKEFKINFLEELKVDLPNLVQGLEQNNLADKNLLADPSEIVDKIQEVINLVKDGGQKIADAFQSVFDGGMFKTMFASEDKQVTSEVMASLDQKLKQIADPKSKIASENITPEAKQEAMPKTDEALDLHNFMRKNRVQQKNMSALKQFKDFSKQDSMFKNPSVELNAQSASAQEVQLNKLLQANKKNPYSDLKANNIIKMNEAVMPVEASAGQNLAQDFLGQGQSQANMMMNLEVPNSSSESTSVFATEGMNNSQSLNLNQMMESSNNKTELIKNVTNYLEQIQFNNQKELDVAVSHNELGNFNIQVSKDTVTNNLDLQIKAMTEEGINFFQENEAELVKTLSDKGIKLSSFKIGSKGESLMTGDSSKSDSGNMNQNSKEQQGQQFSQNRHQNKDQGGPQKRRELWQRYQEQMAS